MCLIGSFAVGKTSLVSQFVSGLFSEKYHTTLGVKIDKKLVETLAGPVNLQIWDVAGDDDYQRLPASYLRGSAGLIVVADGTRPATLVHAQAVMERFLGEIGVLPMVLLLNKRDLPEWSMNPAELLWFEQHVLQVLPTSAKRGEGVAEGFQVLAEALVAGRARP